MADVLSYVSIEGRVLVATSAGTVLAYIAVHLLLRRGASRATRLLGLLLLGGVFNMLGIAVTRGVYHPATSAVALMISFVAVHAVAFTTLLFAYEFVEDDRPRERRIVAWILALAFVPLVVPSLAAPFEGVIEYSPSGQNYYFRTVGTRGWALRSLLPHLYSLYMVVIAYATSLFVMLRKGVRIERSTNGGGVLRALLLPRSEPARAVRDFAALTAGLVGLQFVSWTAASGAGSMVVLMISCACVWVEVNHSAEPTRLRFKLIAIPLAVVVGLLALAGGAVVNDANARLEEERAAEVQRVRAELANVSRAGADEPETWRLDTPDVRNDVLFVASRSLADGGYSERYTEHFARVGFDVSQLAASDVAEREWWIDWTILGGFDGRAGTDEAERRQLLAKAFADGTTPRWSRNPQERWTFHGHPFDRAAHTRSWGWEQDGREFFVGWSEIDWRRRRGDVGLRLMLAILAVGVALVLGLPLLYRTSILRPLEALLGGVRRVTSGDLTQAVEVRANDEIGVLATAFNGMVESVRDARTTLERINAVAFRFVPRAFLRQLGHESILSVQLGDHEQRTMTVLFADVRDFTSLSEHMTPAETFAFVNELLAGLGPVVRRHGGFIDKYLGDAIMALFNEGADNALLAALEMHAALARLNERRMESGQEAIRIGVGLHTGELMLGVIGEAERIDGTVLSDAVNTASRLEGLTKRYGAGILVSGDTIAALEDPAAFRFRDVGTVQVKGREQPVALYEVLGRAADDSDAELDAD